MNSLTDPPKLNTQIYEEACEWLVHFRAGDADHDAVVRGQLDAWLRRSPEHVRAYLEVSAIWEDVASHDAERRIDAEAHIARALSERNVYPLDFGGRDRDITAPSIVAAKAGIPVPSAQRPRRLPFAVAAAALLALGVAVAWVISQRSTYSTAIGEQRSIALDDGSTVELNARSRVRVRYTDGERRVDLLAGQALFRVAKDAHRPFIVASDDTRVRAVGTLFDVNRRPSATTVTVVEGRVSIDSPMAPIPATGRSSQFSAPTAPRRVSATLLDAGQQVTVTPRAIARPKPANVAAATAWTQQRLVFDSVPLSEVAEEFNRYNRRPIVIHDKALESFGVMGVFSSADPASLIRFLRAQPGIDVSEDGAEIVVGRK